MGMKWLTSASKLSAIVTAKSERGVAAQAPSHPDDRPEKTVSYIDPNILYLKWEKCVSTKKYMLVKDSGPFLYKPDRN